MSIHWLRNITYTSTCWTIIHHLFMQMCAVRYAALLCLDMESVCTCVCHRLTPFHYPLNAGAVFPWQRWPLGVNVIFFLLRIPPSRSLSHPSFPPTLCTSLYLFITCSLTNSHFMSFSSLFSLLCTNEMKKTLFISDVLKWWRHCGCCMSVSDCLSPVGHH